MKTRKAVTAAEKIIASRYRRNIVASALIAAACFSSQADAADRYVRAGATGANNGTDWANAWTSLSSINWTTIGSGGTLWIAAGSYSGGLGNPNSINQAVKRATVANHGTSTGWSDAYDGQATVTPSSGTRFLSIGTGADNFVIDGQAWDPWKLKGVGVRGYDGMINQAGADNVTIRGVELDGQQEVTASGGPEDGIRWMGGNGGLIEHTFIHDYGQTGGAHNDAIQGPTCNNIEIRFSRFANSGMHVFLGDYEWGNQYCDGINIHHNVFYNDASGNSYNCIVFKGTHQGAIIDNNTFDIKSQGSVLYLANDPAPGANATNGYFRNNIVYQSDLNDVSFYSHSYNTYYGGESLSETGGSTANPLFVNAAARDYHLQSGSPARSTGTNLGYTTDYAGQTVGNPPDRGAISYASAAPDTTPPSTPTGLSATAVSGSQINLTWTASTDDVAIGGYIIRRCSGTSCTPSTTVQTTVGTGTSWSNTGLTPSTLYRYTVQAYDTATPTANTSSQSSVSQATTQAPAQYTVTPSITLGSTHGSLTPNTPQTVTEGNTTQFTMSPNSTYQAIGAGTCGGSLVGSTYTTNAISGNCSVTAWFVPSTCALVSTADVASGTAMATQTGVFSYTFSVVPVSTTHDLVGGHTNGTFTDFNSFATGVLFDVDGLVKARNGASYTALTSYPYATTTQYNVRMTVNIPSHTYSVWVSPDGGAETQIASNYAFRTSQASVAQLNNFYYVATSPAPVGEYACPIGITSLTPPSAPTNYRLLEIPYFARWK